MVKLRKRFVVVGSGCSGKTCLMVVFNGGEFPEEFVPTVFETYVADITVGHNEVELTLLDTAGPEDYDRLRPLSYPDTDVVLMCFAVDSRSSYDSIQDRWVPEINQHCPDVPIILVCTKKDLRQDKTCLDHLSMKKEKPITEREGKDLAKRINAHAYVECSAMTRHGVDAVFETATKAALSRKRHDNKNKHCEIL